MKMDCRDGSTISNRLSPTSASTRARSSRSGFPSLGEFDLGRPAIVIGPGNQRRIPEDPRGAGLVPREDQRYVPGAEFTLYLARALRREPSPSGDDGDPVAHPFCLLHDVGGEQHRAAFARDLDHHVFHELAVDWIEPAEWLIQDDQLRLMQQTNR